MGICQSSNTAHGSQFSDRRVFVYAQSRQSTHSSQAQSLVRPYKNIYVLRVTRPYLYLLVKPRFFSGFLEKYNFMHFEGEMPSKCIKLYIFSRKKNTKNMCAYPT